MIFYSFYDLVDLISKSKVQLLRPSRPIPFDRRALALGMVLGAVATVLFWLGSLGTVAADVIRL